MPSSLQLITLSVHNEHCHDKDILHRSHSFGYSLIQYKNLDGYSKCKNYGFLYYNFKNNRIELILSYYYFK